MTAKSQTRTFKLTSKGSDRYGCFWEVGKKGTFHPTLGSCAREREGTKALSCELPAVPVPAKGMLIVGVGEPGDPEAMSPPFACAFRRPCSG